MKGIKKSIDRIRNGNAKNFDMDRVLKAAELYSSIYEPMEKVERARYNLDSFNIKQVIQEKYYQIEKSAYVEAYQQSKRDYYQSCIDLVNSYREVEK